MRLKRNTNRKYEELSEVSGGLFSSWRKVGNLKKICLVNCNKTLFVVCLFFLSLLCFFYVNSSCFAKNLYVMEGNGDRFWIQHSKNNNIYQKYHMQLKNLFCFFADLCNWQSQRMPSKQRLSLYS